MHTEHKMSFSWTELNYNQSSFFSNSSSLSFFFNSSPLFFHHLLSFHCVLVLIALTRLALMEQWTVSMWMNQPSRWWTGHHNQLPLHFFLSVSHFFLSHSTCSLLMINVTHIQCWCQQPFNAVWKTCQLRTTIMITELVNYWIRNEWKSNGNENGALLVLPFFFHFSLLFFVIDIHETRTSSHSFVCPSRSLHLILSYAHASSPSIYWLLSSRCHALS